MLSHIFFRKLLHLPVSHLSQFHEFSGQIFEKILLDGMVDVVYFTGLFYLKGLFYLIFLAQEMNYLMQEKRNPAFGELVFFSCFVRREN